MELTDNTFPHGAYSAAIVSQNDDQTSAYGPNL
jgi:hypothetical protein